MILNTSFGKVVDIMNRAKNIADGECVLGANLNDTKLWGAS